ncbi:MAG: hypothetical protein H0U75_05685 [Legionella sp.]|nr:hypothetical protein [Legionella sp.]
MKQGFFSSVQVERQDPEDIEETLPGYYLEENQMGNPALALNFCKIGTNNLPGFQNITRISHRLWSSYQMMQADFSDKKFSASTTVYDGEGKFLTATCSRTSKLGLFLAIYDECGYALNVFPLNSSPDSEKIKKYESQKKQEGSTKRAKEKQPVQSTLYIKFLEKIIDGIPLASIGKIQIIYCENFKVQSLKETYLLRALRLNDPIGIESEQSLARKLSQDVLQDIITSKPNLDGSEYNISFVILTIKQYTPAFLLGLYCSHEKEFLSKNILESIWSYFEPQCRLSNSEYSKLPFSVSNNIKDFNIANRQALLKALTTIFKEYLSKSDEIIISDSVKAILCLLENQEIDYKKRLMRVYESLCQPMSHIQDLNLIDYIRLKDKGVFAKIFLEQLFGIASSQLLGVLPKLYTSTLIYLTSEKYMWGREFAKKMEKLQRLPLHLLPTDEEEQETCLQSFYQKR